jgi:putative ABC transport system permease protein
MNWIALRMLTGDPAKYLGLIFGVTFATFLMSQQVSVFMGILMRTGNAILDVQDADIWVMDIVPLSERTKRWTPMLKK